MKKGNEAFRRDGEIIAEMRYCIVNQPIHHISHITLKIDKSILIRLVKSTRSSDTNESWNFRRTKCVNVLPHWARKEAKIP